MSEQAALQIIVHGRVQGVYFRLFTQRKARELKLAGTVRNLPGGTSVEVIVEGEIAKLDSLVEFLKKGPPGARVTKTEISRTSFTGSY
ncbi:MAG: acylphosphatase, partial [Dehalococcoidales bacterium]|nr:acylphosphatase [Dehalococcoidales bacterium]